MTLFNITPTDARQYKQHLIASGLRPQTINRRLLSLKYFLKWSWDTKKVKYPFPLPKTVKQTQAIPKWLSRTQQNQVLRHIERQEKPRDLAIVRILMNTGLRVSELCNLKWVHVIMTERKGKLLVNAGKGRKYREVPLNKDARQAFLDLDHKTHAGSECVYFQWSQGSPYPSRSSAHVKTTEYPR